jgi:hypothetical protein
LDDLPDAVIFGEILVRLPAKDVFRCRAVHKSWRSGTSSTNFLTDHHCRQPKLPILLINRLTDFDSLGSYVVCHSAGIGTVNQKLKCVVPSGEEGRPVFLEATHDGLLIVFYKGVFWVYNPATQQGAPIPQLRHCFEISIVGFYRHLATGEYRVVDWDHSTGLFSILTLGSDAPPRCIRHQSSSVLSFSFAQALMSYSFRFETVLHRDDLHWYDSGSITVFCTTVETFRRMRGPVLESPAACLLEMEGMLAMCGSSAEGLVINIWVMQDYRAQV